MPANGLCKTAKSHRDAQKGIKWQKSLPEPCRKSGRPGASQGRRESPASDSRFAGGGYGEGPSPPSTHVTTPDGPRWTGQRAPPKGRPVRPEPHGPSWGSHEVPGRVSVRTRPLKRLLLAIWMPWKAFWAPFVVRTPILCWSALDGPKGEMGLMWASGGGRQENAGPGARKAGGLLLFSGGEQ